MALDIPATPSGTQLIRIARAAYDVARDGLGQGSHTIPSQQVPNGSMVIGWAWMAVDPLVSASTSGLLLHCGYWDSGPAVDPVDLQQQVQFPTPANIGVMDGSQPITVEIQDADMASGSMLIWVFYLTP